MTVFVVQEPLHRNSETGAIEPRMNLKAADSFGERTFLASWRALENIDALDSVIEDIEDKMFDFCDDDYILPVGNPILIGIVSAIAASNNFGRMKILYWDRKDRSYQVVPVRLEDFTETEKGTENDDATDNEARGKAEGASV